MISWKNLDALDAYKKLGALRNHVDLAKTMAGAEGAGDGRRRFGRPGGPVPGLGPDAVLVPGD